MPELPEVENVVRTLRPRLVGATIASVTVLEPMSIREPEPAEFARLLSGRRVLDITRRGKFLVCRLDDGRHLVVHLRMTGRLVMSGAAEPEPRFARVAIRLEDGRVLWFSDMRKFGRLAVVADPERLLAGLGPEPLDPGLSAARLHAAMRGRKRPIKSLLLDQSFLAGLGNIYADEALFHARIHPCRPACDISLEEAGALLAAIRTVLLDAIANRGTTIADYVDAEGKPGDNQARLVVYGRGGQACPRCAAVIGRLRLAGRSTCFCPECQPPPRDEG